MLISGDDEHHQARLLLIDDDPLMLQLLAELLSDTYQLIIAKNATKALKLLQRENSNIDLIMLDWQMPELSGIELCRKIKALPEFNHIPLIFLTGHQDTQIEEEGITAGAVDFIVKPFSDAVLKARLKTHLDLAFKSRALQRQALYDSLTGLPNRVLFNDRLQQAVAQSQRSQTMFALIFLDIDYFKQINDSLGHLAGDHLLFSVAQRLAGVLRKTDTVCRHGGDEFMILLANVMHAKDVTLVADKIETAMATSFQLDESELHITVSTGAAIFPEDGSDSYELMQNADRALYFSKESGRSRFTLYSKNVHHSIIAKKEFHKEIKLALERKEFIPHYQPIVDMDSQRIRGFEVLARWDRGGEALFYPDQFIPEAEKCGLIGELGISMLEQACRQLAEWKTLDHYISVNVSAIQLGVPGFSHLVKGCLEKYQVAGTSLILEFTESSLMSCREQAVIIMQELKDLGVRIAIDDFGTGFACLNNLKDFPIDIVKIDKCFVQDLEKSQFDRDLVGTLIELAEKVSLTVIAEGVESLDQAHLLAAMNCQRAQGYLYGKPVHAAEITQLVVSDEENWVK